MDEESKNDLFEGISKDQHINTYLDETSQLIICINQFTRNDNISMREYRYLEDLVDCLHQFYQYFEKYKEKKQNSVEKKILQRQRVIFDSLKIGYKLLGYEVSEKDDKCFTISNGDHHRYFDYLKIGQRKIFKDINLLVFNGNSQDVIVIENIGFSNEMQSDAIEISIQGIDRFDEENIAETFIKENINNLYPANWSCAINNSPKNSCSCNTSCYICLTYQQYNIHLWQENETDSKEKNISFHNPHEDNVKSFSTQKDTIIANQKKSKSCLLI